MNEKKTDELVFCTFFTLDSKISNDKTILFFPVKLFPNESIQNLHILRLQWTINYVLRPSWIEL